MIPGLSVELLPNPVGVKPGTPSPKRGRNAGGHPVLIRLPQGVIEHIDAAAAAQLRSRAAEIRMRLEASMVNESIDEHGVIVVQYPPRLK